jgi:mannosyltransferase OCH1-like enzyme
MKLFAGNDGEVYILTPTGLKYARHPLALADKVYDLTGLGPIPRIIHQTWVTKDLPPGMQSAVDALKAANPGWEHRLYNDEFARRFIIKHFDPHVTWAYDTLIPGTYKADLFRYCVMYIYGGVYLDIKYAPVNGFSFESWLPNETYVLEFGPFVYQGCFMCPPRHPRLKDAIDNVVSNVRNGLYGDCHVCTTGPHMFGRLFSHKQRSSLTYLYRNSGVEILDMTTGAVLLRQYDGYRDYQKATYEKAGTKYWSTMWQERSIFDSSKLSSRHVPPPAPLSVSYSLTTELIDSIAAYYKSKEIYNKCKYSTIVNIERNMPAVDTAEIPNNLFLYWHQPVLPQDMTNNINVLKLQHPTLNMQIFDDDSSRKFISEYFTDIVLYAYDKLNPIAFKSDLWRYCALYVFGGYYLDVKYTCIGDFRLTDIVDTTLVEDRKEFFPNGKGIYNAFIVAKPREEFLKNAIYRIIFNCASETYGDTCLYPTGPGLLGLTVPDSVDYTYKYAREQHGSEITDMIVKEDRVVLKNYPAYRRDQALAKTEYYSDLWSQQKLFTSSNNIPHNVFQLDDMNDVSICERFDSKIDMAYTLVDNMYIKKLLLGLCHLYFNGGVLVDSGCTLTESVQNITLGDSLLFVSDISAERFAIIGLPVFNPICLTIIEKIVDMIRESRQIQMIYILKDIINEEMIKGSKYGLVGNTVVNKKTNTVIASMS